MEETREETLTEAGGEENREVEVIINKAEEEESQDDVINLGDSGQSPEPGTDEDPGYEIVTEDKGTNCPSLPGSLKKEGKRRREAAVDQIKKEESPATPRRQNKRWSKLMKYTLPSKNPESSKEKVKKNKERKSLKDKMKDNDLVAFLTERRAVSESRFRVLDKIGDSAEPTLVKTKSDQSLEEGWNTGTGITTGTIRSLKAKFEQDEEIIFDLQTPVIVKDATSDTSDLAQDQEMIQTNIEAEPSVAEDALDGENVKSSSGSSAKINETPLDSGNDEKKKKGKKKDKKKCDVCSSDKEHKEHRREKRRLKKEKKERKKEKEASINNLHKTEEFQEAKQQLQQVKPEAAPPPPPAVTVSQIQEAKARINGDNFFQKLLMKDEHQKYTRLERPSRPSKKDKKYVFHPTEPALGKYLKGKKAVSESKFKQSEEFEKFVERSLLPRGIIKCEEFNEKKSVFEQPRSSSSLSRVSPSPRVPSAERPISSLSLRSASMPRSRPGSSMSQVSNSSYIVDKQEYNNYVYEMINSVPKNARFNQLTQYFSTLERVTKLESESSKMDVHKLKSEDIVDFETWRQLRKQEKAKDELDELLGDLRAAQKAREFHFRPKEVESVRWSGDSRLRGRDRSVENLRNIFSRNSPEEKGESVASKYDTGPNKDVYKLYWRPKSVTDLSQDLPEKNEKPAKVDVAARFTTYPKSRNVQSPYNVLTQQRSRSSLSMDQVSAIKTQLNEILSAKNSNASSIQSSRSPSRAENFSVEVKGKGEPHPLQSLGLFVKPIPDVVKKSFTEAEKMQEQKTLPRSRSAEEEERKRLSKTITEELLKKVNFHNEKASADFGKKKINFDVDDTKMSPRTCHSLERDEGIRKSHDEDNDFILVLSDGEQKNNDEVEETLDKWASAGESEDEQSKINEIRKRLKGRVSGLQSSQSSDSISSGTSVHTVIYQGVRGKTNYYEKIQAPAETEKTKLKENEANVEPGKTISDIKKELESNNFREKLSLLETKAATYNDENVIPTNLVREIRKSFENMKLPDPPTEEELLEVAQTSCSPLPPVIPQRTSSYKKSKHVSLETEGGERASPGSKSVCSVPDNCKDEGYSTFPNTPRKQIARPVDYLEKTYIPEKSISNVDLTDSENNGLEETFGKMHEKVHSLGASNDMMDYSYGYKSLPYIQEPTYVNNPNKYNRAYLTIHKAGDVKEKLEQFEGRNDGAQLRSLPAVDRNYIRDRATNTNKVVIKSQEVSDVTSIKQRLQRYEKDRDLFDYCTGMLTKEKLKYFCKKVGHSKIISRMAALQRSAHVDDDAGFKKLNLKASAETEYISKYRSGEVESKKTAFEQYRTPGSGPTSNHSGPASTQFSWSSRFSRDFQPRYYSEAEKQNQFRHYYGYHPAEAPSVARLRTYPQPGEMRELTRIGSRKPIYHPCQQPASLPVSLTRRPEGWLQHSGASSLTFNRAQPTPASTNTTARQPTNQPSIKGAAYV